MIDWANLAANSLWIVGCALGLAVLSLASWQAAARGVRLRDQLSRPGTLAALNLAGLLFCAGLAAVDLPAWQRLLWAVLGVLFLLQALANHRLARQKPG